MIRIIKKSQFINKRFASFQTISYSQIKKFPKHLPCEIQVNIYFISIDQESGNVAKYENQDNQKEDEEKIDILLQGFSYFCVGKSETINDKRNSLKYLEQSFIKNSKIVKVLEI